MEHLHLDGKHEPDVEADCADYPSVHGARWVVDGCLACSSG
jgi:hypothetical protein